MSGSVRLSPEPVPDAYDLLDPRFWQHWPFCGVLPDRVRVLADLAERADEIERARAGAAQAMRKKGREPRHLDGDLLAEGES